MRTTIGHRTVQCGRRRRREKETDIIYFVNRGPKEVEETAKSRIIMEAEAMHDFVPKEITELAFKKGDTLLLLNYGEDPDLHWFSAQKEEKTGLVPENYLKIECPPWYFGRISRYTAEQILLGNQNDGAFLVRLSESAPSEFSLSVKCGNSIQHFRILKDDEFKYFLWSTKFNSINELVNYYRNETVSKNNNIYLRDPTSDGQFIATTIYDFSAENEQDREAELEFKKGEFVTVFDTSDENWWGGRIGNRTGYFPRLYVVPCVPMRNVQAGTTSIATHN